MKPITVSPSLLIGLGGALLVTMLGLVFFLGRESARNVPQTQARAAVLPAETQRITAPQPTPIPPAELRISPSTPVQTSPLPAFSLPQAPEAPLPRTNPPAPDGLRASVAAYFEAVNQIQPGQMAGDPSEMANKIVEGMGKGDMSGLDDLTSQMASAKRRLEALKPPQPCAGHYRESLACLDESLKMIQGMKKAIETSDLDALSRLSSHGNELRNRTEALAREEQEIRQRYGLSK